MKKLPKQQKGAFTSQMGFEVIYGSDQFYILYIDNDKNLDLKTDEKPATHLAGAGGFLTAYRVSNDGSKEKFIVTDIEKINGREVFQFDTDRILPIKDDKFLMEMYKKDKEDVLITVDM